MLRRASPLAALILGLAGIFCLVDLSGATIESLLPYAAPLSPTPVLSTSHMLRVASLRGGDKPSLVRKRPKRDLSNPKDSRSDSCMGGAHAPASAEPLKRIALRGGKAAEEAEGIHPLGTRSFCSGRVRDVHG